MSSSRNRSQDARVLLRYLPRHSHREPNDGSGAWVESAESFQVKNFTAELPELQQNNPDQHPNEGDDHRFQIKGNS